MLARSRALLQALVLALVVLLPAARVHAATVVTWDGPGDFDTATLTVPGFYANVLTSVAGPGFYHDHGLNRVFSGSLLIDGLWTEIGNSGPTFGASGDVPLSSIGPLSFAGGVITALRLSVNEPVGSGFHSVFGTQFTFDVAQTPLPGALALFGSVLGLVAVGRWIRRTLCAASPATA